ncbi:hypothetical protein Tco_0418275 [Tanacetum coccineum]
MVGGAGREGASRMGSRTEGVKDLWALSGCRHDLGGGSCVVRGNLGSRGGPHWERSWVSLPMVHFVVWGRVRPSIPLVRAHSGKLGDVRGDLGQLGRWVSAWVSVLGGVCFSAAGCGACGKVAGQVWDVAFVARVGLGERGLDCEMERRKGTPGVGKGGKHDLKVRAGYAREERERGWGVLKRPGVNGAGGDGAKIVVVGACLGGGGGASVGEVVGVWWWGGSALRCSCGNWVGLGRVGWVVWPTGVSERGSGGIGTMCKVVTATSGVLGASGRAWGARSELGFGWVRLWRGGGLDGHLVCGRGRCVQLFRWWRFVCRGVGPGRGMLAGVPQAAMGCTEGRGRKVSWRKDREDVGRGVSVATVGGLPGRGVGLLGCAASVTFHKNGGVVSRGPGQVVMGYSLLGGDWGSGVVLDEDALAWLGREREVLGTFTMGGTACCFLGSAEESLGGEGCGFGGGAMRGAGRARGEGRAGGVAENGRGGFGSAAGEGAALWSGGEGLVGGLWSLFGLAVVMRPEVRHRIGGVASGAGCGWGWHGGEEIGRLVLVLVRWAGGAWLRVGLGVGTAWQGGAGGANRGGVGAVYVGLSGGAK